MDTRVWAGTSDANDHHMCEQDAQEDVVREIARIRELNPELSEEQLLEAVAPPQGALDAAVSVQQVPRWVCRGQKCSGMGW